MQENEKGRLWHSVSMLVFAALVALLAYQLDKANISVKKFSVYDIVFMILGSYRLTRILVYDKVFKFFRDLIKKFSKISLFNSIREILTCPWCAGIWAVWVICYLYFLIPYGDVLVVLLALAGVSTFIQILSNLVGIKAKETQNEIKYKEKLRN